MKKESKRGMLNVAENKLQNIFKKLGHSYSRRGYPDFTVFDSNGEIYGFIEVKPFTDKKLKKNQELFRLFCERYEIPFLKWTPEMGEKAIHDFINYDFMNEKVDILASFLHD